jgi:hypothetical protein
MARVVYRTAAALSLLLIPVLWVAFGGGMLGPLRPILRPLLFVGSARMALTGLGIEYFLLRFDDSHPLQQGFWFCRMLLAREDPLFTAFNGIRAQRY